MKRHKWNKKTDKINWEAHCTLCGLKKEVLGKHFGVIYYFDDNGFRFDLAPDCLREIKKDAEKISIDSYYKKIQAKRIK